MALIKTINRNGEMLTPRIANDVIMMENATVVGDVSIGEGTTLWFNTVLRGDVNSIRIGNRVNIQDGSVLHTLYEKSVCEIGNDVSIGHNVTIHGAKVCDLALIGMGAVVMDNAVVGEGAIVAAGAVGGIVIVPPSRTVTASSRGTSGRIARLLNESFSMNPLRASALRCSTTPFVELMPNESAISRTVGG